MPLHDLLDTLFTRLAWASLQAIALTALVALVIRLLPRLPAAVRCLMWWLVGAQLLLGLCWPAPVSLRLLPPPEAPAAVMPATPAADLPDTSRGTPSIMPTAPSGSPVVVAPASGLRTPRLATLLTTLWLIGLGLQGALAVRHWRRSRRVVNASTLLDDDALATVCRHQARLLGLRHVPALRCSGTIDSPQVSGLRHPVILLPAGNRLTPAESAMAVAHELAHLRRGDLWLGWIPALAQRLFFFHPLAAWAMREYALCREAACDALVVDQAGIAAGAYGHLLLRMGVAAPTQTGLAGASPTFRTLKRRLTMLQHHQNTPRRSALWLPVLLLALAGVVPWRVTAREATPALPAQPPRSHASAPPAVAAHAVASPAPHPRPHAAPRAEPRHVTRLDIDTRASAHEGFALYDGKTMTVQGASADVDRAAGQLDDAKHPMLWVRRGDKAWVIRDPSLLKAARVAYAPVTTLSHEQNRLARMQGALADQQAAFADQQGVTAAREADRASRQAALAAEQTDGLAGQASRQAAEQAELQAQRSALEAEQRAMQSRQEAARARLARADASKADRQREQAELARERTELAARRQALETAASKRAAAADKARQAMQAQRAAMQRERARMQSQRAGEQARLAERQRALASEQADLASQQRRLSRHQMEAVAKAREAMRGILDRALAKGLAQPVPLD